MDGPNLKRLPNAISLFRGLLTIPIVFYTVSAGDRVPVAAVGLLALAWLTDILDGWLARRLDARSELGRVLDPVADKAVIGGTSAALWVAGRMPGWLALVVIARDAAILALSFPVFRRAGAVPESNLAGKIALAILVMTLAAYLAGWSRATGILQWVALGAVVISAGSYTHRFLVMTGPTGGVQRQ